MTSTDRDGPIVALSIALFRKESEPRELRSGNILDTSAQVNAMAFIPVIEAHRPVQWHQGHKYTVISAAKTHPIEEGQGVVPTPMECVYSGERIERCFPITRWDR